MDKFYRNRGIINRCQTGPLTQEQLAQSLEINQGRVSQLDGQVPEAGEAGRVVKQATGAPPKLTTEQRAQLPELLSKGAEYDGFHDEVWTSACVGEVLKQPFGVTYEVESIGLIRKQLGLTRQTPGLSSKFATCSPVAGGDFTRVKNNGGGREPPHFFWRGKRLLLTSPSSAVLGTRGSNSNFIPTVVKMLISPSLAR